MTASDKQLASEARRFAVEEDFDKAIDRAVAIGMNKEEILEKEYDLDELSAKRLEWGLFRDRRPEYYSIITKTAHQ